jgi:hypothetical protein
MYGSARRRLTQAGSVYGKRDLRFRVKHSRHSHARLTDERAALALVHILADAEVAQLCATTHDVRVVPWGGTAHGVLPGHHPRRQPSTRTSTTRRPERNMLRVITGEWDVIDRGTYD